MCWKIGRRSALAGLQKASRILVALYGTSSWYRVKRITTKKVQSRTVSHVGNDREAGARVDAKTICSNAREMRSLSSLAPLKRHPAFKRYS